MLSNVSDEDGTVEHDKEVNYIEVGLDTCLNVDGVRERTNPFKVTRLHLSQHADLIRAARQPVGAELHPFSFHFTHTM